MAMSEAMSGAKIGEVNMANVEMIETSSNQNTPTLKESKEELDEELTERTTAKAWFSILVSVIWARIVFTL